MKLKREYVEKPWGRTLLPAIFDPPEGKRIGEVWFTGAPDLPLLAKYIFTTERLSIQVHPDDQQARARGYRSGKTECWYILEAEPDASIGLGLTHEITPGELRASALDGSIEQLIDWKPAQAGNFIFVPPGTIHAIGAGITLLEFQQNADLTYRLYDYGRPRELHLEDGMAVASAASFDERLIQQVSPGEERMLVDGPAFRLASTNRDAFTDERRWVLPIDGAVKSEDAIAGAGECLVVEPGKGLESDGAWALIGTTA
jgi:mannose-6-phosphate isomerase